MSAEFSIETLQARRYWPEIYNVMKSENLQPRLLDPARQSIKIEREVKSFPDRKKLKKVITNKPEL